MIAEAPRVDSFRSALKKSLCLAGVFSLIFNKGPDKLRPAGLRFYAARDFPVAGGKLPRRTEFPRAAAPADGRKKAVAEPGKPQRARGKCRRPIKHATCGVSLIDCADYGDGYTRTGNRMN